MHKAITSVVLSSFLPFSMYVAAHAQVAHRTFPVACRATDGFAADVRSYVIDVTTGVDSLSRATRAAWKVPVIRDTTEIFFVSDSATCTRAAIAHARAEGRDTLNAPPVYLLAVGPTRYVVFNGARAGEFFVHYLLDARFKVLESF